MNSNPLAARSPNTHLAVSNEQDLKTASSTTDLMDYHRQKLQGKIESQDKYVFVYLTQRDWLMLADEKEIRC
jgi:arginine utilization protein RocB